MSSEPVSSDDQSQQVNLSCRAIIFRAAVLLIAAALIISLWQVGCSESKPYKPAPSTPGQPLVKTEPEPAPTVISAAGFTLFVSGNWGGQLGPCGCSDRQLGGIDRRTHILNGVPDPSRLLIDAGPLIKNEGRQAQLKLETFIQSLQHLHYDALALTWPEIITLQLYLALDPAVRPPVIATNLPQAVRREYAAVPYLEKTLRRGENTLDCLILAIIDPQSMIGRWDAPQQQLPDPIESLMNTLNDDLNIDPRQPSLDKLVIVLLPHDSEPLLRQLSQITALDLLVKVGYGDLPELIENSDNNPVVVTTGSLGKFITQIDLPANTPADLTKAQFKPVPVEENFPRDPQIVGFFNDYQTNLEIENLIDTLPRLPLLDDNIFTGSKACADCHQDIYLIWESFGHAHAMETLVNENRQFDPECVICHTVGMEYEIGYRSLETTSQLASVGCEMCHGPGFKHRENTLTMYQEQFYTCEKCHTTENSPHFYEERQEYFEIIKHWIEPRIYWK